MKRGRLPSLPVEIVLRIFEELSRNHVGGPELSRQTYKFIKNAASIRALWEKKKQNAERMITCRNLVAAFVDRNHITDRGNYVVIDGPEGEIAMPIVAQIGVTRWPPAIRFDNRNRNLTVHIRWRTDDPLLTPWVVIAKENESGPDIPKQWFPYSKLDVYTWCTDWRSNALFLTREFAMASPEEREEMLRELKHSSRWIITVGR